MKLQASRSVEDARAQSENETRDWIWYGAAAWLCVAAAVTLFLWTRAPKKKIRRKKLR